MVENFEVVQCCFVGYSLEVQCCLVEYSLEVHYCLVENFALLCLLSEKTVVVLWLLIVENLLVALLLSRLFLVSMSA